MARFNSKKVSVYAPPGSKNLAGGEAYLESPKVEIVSILLTSLVQDTFYRTAQETSDRLAELVDGMQTQGDRQFVAKAGIYARHYFGMRSISHLLASYIGLSYKGETWTKSFFRQVIKRPDDMAEIMSLILKSHEPIPNAMKKGFAAALSKFSMYQLGKYRMENRAVKMVDVINMVHPRYTEGDAIDKLIHGTLKAEDTWEKNVSAAGQDKTTSEEVAEAKTGAWRNMILSGKLGYMALLKNLRNIFQSLLTEDTTTKGLVLQQLTDVAAIKKSLVFPFRFKTAWNEISGSTLSSTDKRLILGALNEAATLSLSNVPKFEGPTLVVLDESGSMKAGTVGTSTANEVGSLFAAALWKANVESDLMVFSDDAHYIQENALGNGIINISDALSKNAVGHTTNFSAPFVAANKPYARIIVISDMQGWVRPIAAFRDGFKAYCQRFNCRPHLYSFDLCGLGSLQWPEDKTYLLAGFSDKVFDVMKMLETDRMALVHEIERKVRL